MEKLLIYGSNGYTGRLIVEEAVRRNLKPVLAGRNHDAISAQARALGLEYKVLSLDSVAEVAKALDGFRTVLHCAGPFIRTASVMADACIQAGADYLDITGEIPVFEMLFARSNAAQASQVSLMPGTGFDIVPSDCLALKLSESLPGADSLELAFAPRGGISPGTAKTMVEFIHEGCVVRRGGKLETLKKPVFKTVPFQDRTRECVSISWGDVSTAYRTTGIGNVTTYMYQKGAAGMVKFQPVLNLARFAPVRSALQAIIAKKVKGPDETVRENGEVQLWGKVARANESVEYNLITPEGYLLTALTSVEIASRSLKRGISPGFQTPAHQFGSGFIETFPGVTLKPRTGPVSPR